MNPSPVEPDPRKQGEQIALYARRYAQSRTLPFLVQMGLFLVLCVVIGGISLGGGLAFVKGSRLLLAVALLALTALAVFVIWISVPRWGGRRLWQFGNDLYGREGQAGIAHPSRIKWPKWGYLLMPFLLACVFAHYGTAVAGWTPARYAQPISVLYIVPFSLAMYWIQRKFVGPWMLSAPILSILYAFLVLIGLPLASDRFEMFWVNLYVPMFGFQILAMILGHFYNRYTLAKLKQLARVEAEEDGHG